MSEENKQETKDAKATPEKGNSVEQAADLEIAEHNKKMLQDASNVSIDDLKAARQASLKGESVKSDEKVTEQEASKEEKGDESKTSNNSDENLDDILKDIVNEEETKNQVDPDKKDDRPQHRQDGEWKRKYDELKEEVESIKNQTSQAPGIKPYSEEWYENVAAEHGMSVDEAKKVIPLLEKGYQTGIAPQIEALKDEIKQLKSKEFAKDVKSKAEKDELYSIVKDDYTKYYEEFKAKGLPEDVVADYAMSKAKEKNYPKLIKAVRKHEKAKAQDQRRVIPSEEASVGYSGLKISSKLPKLTKEDLEVMRKMGYKKKDIESFGNTPSGFTE